MAAIPASRYVNVNSAVITAGGNALAMVGLVLTNNIRMPFGAPVAFATASGVASYFGPSSTEAGLASVYFKGFDNATQTPASMLFAAYASNALAAFVRGGTGLTLPAVQVIAPGTLSINISGTVYNSGTINLSGATSFSNAASLIQAGFTSPALPGTVTYDSVAGAFQITTTATGATTTIAAPTGALAAPLLLTTATGAVLSQGAAVDTPLTAMTRITNATQNFVSFTTAFNPDLTGNANKVAFAQWTDSTNGRYGYIAWDQDASAVQTGNTTSLGPILAQNNYDGTVAIYTPTYGATMAAFVMGVLASVNYGLKNGVTNTMYRSQSGLAGEVTDASVAANLNANGYNFYGAVATANQGFTFYQYVKISGSFNWSDAYFNQIWMNNALQLAGMELLVTAKSIPLDSKGYAMVKAGFTPPITDAVNFGMIQPGVDLSAAQIAEVNAAAGGLDISNALYAQGYYLEVQPAFAQVRGARGPLQVLLFYTNGGEVNTINLTNTLVQ